MIRIFRHYIPESMILLALSEGLILAVSVYLGYGIRFAAAEIPAGEVELLLPRAITFSVVGLICMTAMGLYWRQLRPTRLVNVMLRVAGAFLLALALLALAFYLAPELSIGRGALAVVVGLAYLGVSAARIIHYWVADHERLKSHILVVGAGHKAKQLEALRRRADWHGFRLVGYVHVRGEHDEVDSNKILAQDRSLEELVEEHEIDEIIVAVNDRRKSFPVDEILECKLKGVEVIDLITFFERQTGKIKLDALHPSSMIFSDGFSKAVLKTTGKRVFDIVASFILLLGAWPFMLITAVAIWLETGRPIFYRQERVGLHGEPFEVLKFRSMTTDAEAQSGAQWAQKNDTRVTRVGAVIRKYRIDELPQLLNVLRGDMSFVGPRPERPQFVKELSEEIPFYDLRHKVSPGITGWAQISYPYGASVQDAVEKLQYDLYYIKNYSLIFDLMILFQTAHAVAGGRGAR